MDEVIIELLYLPDRSRSHARVTAFPATIGRGYENQVVLYDPEVSTVHARLERDETGALRLLDAGSTNGVLVDGVEEKVASVEVTHGLVVRLGNTELVFKQASRPAEKTVVSRRAVRVDPLGSKRVLSAAAAVLVGLLLFQDYRSSVAQPDPGDLLGLAFMSLVLCMVYAALWSVLGRLVTHGWRYLPHLTLGMLGFASVIFVGGLVPAYVDFAFDAPTVAEWLTPVLLAAVAAAALQAHLQRGASWSRRRSRVVAATLVLSVLGVYVGRSLLSRESFTSSLPLSGQALPPRYRLVAARPVQALFTDADALKVSVDELAAQE